MTKKSGNRYAKALAYTILVILGIIAVCVVVVLVIAGVAWVLMNVTWAPYALFGMFIFGMVFKSVLEEID